MLTSKRTNYKERQQVAKSSYIAGDAARNALYVNVDAISYCVSRGDDCEVIMNNNDKIVMSFEDYAKLVGHTDCYPDLVTDNENAYRLLVSSNEKEYDAMVKDNEYWKSLKTTIDRINKSVEDYKINVNKNIVIYHESVIAKKENYKELIDNNKILYDTLEANVAKYIQKIKDSGNVWRYVGRFISPMQDNIESYVEQVNENIEKYKNSVDRQIVDRQI